MRRVSAFKVLTWSQPPILNAFDGGLRSVAISACSLKWLPQYFKWEVLRSKEASRVDVPKFSPAR